jgi:hypothetical protein
MKMITVTLLYILHRHCQVTFINLERANSQNGGLPTVGCLRLLIQGLLNSNSFKI